MTQAEAFEALAKQGRLSDEEWRIWRTIQRQ
jgi:hypothetical protein